MLRTILFCFFLLSCKKISFWSPNLGGNGGGKRGETTTEVLTPTLLRGGVLDILLVIDNSDSMSEEQDKLANKLGSLLLKISETDWQLAIATTDPRDCLKLKITKNTPNYEQKFRDTVSSLGVLGTTHEQAIRMSVVSLQGDCDDKPWLREDSTVVVLLVTDEDHLSDGFCGSVDERGLSYKPVPREQCEIRALYDHFAKIRVARTTARVYGLLNMQKASKFQTKKMPDGKLLFDFISSIHAEDYTNILANISDNIRLILQQFKLSKMHDNKSSAIVINSKDGSRKLGRDEYRIGGDTLIINTPLPAGVIDIKITYSHN